MATSVTVEDLVGEFPQLKDLSCSRRDFVERKLAEAEAFTESSFYTEDQYRYVVIRRARWLLHTDGCPFPTQEQADTFKASLEEFGAVGGFAVL